MNPKLNQKALAQILQGFGAALNLSAPKAKSKKPHSVAVHSNAAPAHQALPHGWNNLDVKCVDARHFAPVPASFVRFSTSDKGRPVAHYKCPVCGKSYFFAKDQQGKPACLFTKG